MIPLRDTNGIKIVTWGNVMEEDFFLLFGIHEYPVLLKLKMGFSSLL